MKRVLITGGSGLVGSFLSSYLMEQGYQVAHLSRKPKSLGYKTFLWDYTKGEIDIEAIEFADIIIHLAGENISKKRWTKAQRKVILDSRVETTHLLKSAIEKAKNKPDLFISASAIGYYGTFNSETIFFENDTSGQDFLANVVEQWEAAVDGLKETGVAVVKVRTGVVMDKDKGAFVEMMKPVNLGIASALGSGKQYVPWISNMDLARSYTFLITMFSEDKLKYDVYNAVAPEYITNKEMTKVMTVAYSKPMFMPAIPALVLKLLYGEMSSILLYGSRISSKRMIDEGFIFDHKTLQSWLENI